MTASAPSTRRPPLAARLLAAVFGLLLALGLGELIATWAFDGAYPTLNLYEPDARFGVVLTPHGETRVVSPTGIITDIRTNALGFRGADWPPPAAGPEPVPGRVLVVGDSMVMGWGVAEGNTFAARLFGREVLAAGVPTWGPSEYVEAVAELVPRFRPEHVVLVFNAANDFDEASIPNVRRTTARDGWARVPLGAPAAAAPVIDLPFRRFLFGRSHLVLALRLLFDPPDHPALAPRLATRFVADLPRHLAPAGEHRSPLTRHVLAARAHAARHGATLVPVLVPMDIQVHPAEWTKYGVPPRDARPTLALTSALLADVPALVDLTPALVAASPGAFLPDDYHLSAVGHAAVAAALAPRLSSTQTTMESRR